jgi:hypothetical protein
MRPLAIDLCCGLGGWTEGLMSEGWRVRGYDIEAHKYGEDRYPAELVLRNVLEMLGSEIADAGLIVASPPCTEYSYMAMPWSRAKQIARALRGEDEFPEPYRGSRSIAELNAIFDACFRIQREASEAAGRHIPMVVENVKGAQPWVGRAAWSFGSFFLWGDIPALMPVQRYHQRLKVKAGEITLSQARDLRGRIIGALRKYLDDVQVYDTDLALATAYATQFPSAKSRQVLDDIAKEVRR